MATSTTDPGTNAVGCAAGPALYQRLRPRLALSGPLLWLLVAYIGSLVALLVTSLYHYQNDRTGLGRRMVTSPSSTNYPRVL